MSKKFHETTKVLRKALTMNKLDCKRIYNYDSIHQTNSKAYLITTKKKLSSLKRTISELNPNYNIEVIKTKKGTSLRVVEYK